ncbi:hypothetical protein Rhe02_88230 [Rhizocola hellebori]|uniref:CBM6 domain-containing protein n=1 Tax=Rhizocola hellebori TaxID=1392758 RepID=A0A8J3QHJ5_9ACTN|nr:DUF1996 domain-containing protein [Rhizocola hellebori]GIH10756.1 hypothetical protein Rhe02_88230 [Rhizocola hellebori]
MLNRFLAVPVALALAISAGLTVHRLTLTAGPPDPHAGHVMPGDIDAAAIRAQQIAALPGSEFRADCRGTHVAGDDPIVKFNQFGASHLHQFIGNASANAASTEVTLRAGSTNCNPVVDKSPYWVPALYKNGVHVPPESVIIYYQGLTNPQTAVAYPQGLKIVVGNAAATGPDQNPSARWNCTPGSASSRDFMNCPAGTKLQTYLDFPTCWNGRDLDSPNHFSHMAWALGGIGAPCPGTHPVAVPRVQFVITYNVNGTGLTLAGTRNGVNVTDAPGYTFHGDFWNVWDQAELERRVRNCINAGYICGNDGCPIGGPPCATPTPTPTPGGNRDAYGTIQAESFDSQSGLSVQATSDAGGGQNLSAVNNGNWAVYRGVNFGAGTAHQFRARVASGAAGGVSGLVEVRLGSATAPVIGSFAVANTGGWQSWQTVPTNISGVTGTHDVYLTFSSGQPADFVNVNWFSFAS